MTDENEKLQLAAVYGQMLLKENKRLVFGNEELVSQLEKLKAAHEESTASAERFKSTNKRLQHKLDEALMQISRIEEELRTRETEHANERYQLIQDAAAQVDRKVQEQVDILQSQWSQEKHVLETQVRKLEEDVRKEHTPKVPASPAPVTVAAPPHSSAIIISLQNQNRDLQKELEQVTCELNELTRLNSKNPARDAHLFNTDPWVFYFNNLYASIKLELEEDLGYSQWIDAQVLFDQAKSIPFHKWRKFIINKHTERMSRQYTSSQEMITFQRAKELLEKGTISFSEFNKIVSTDVKLRYDDNDDQEDDDIL